MTTVGKAASMALAALSVVGCTWLDRRTGSSG